MLDIILIDGVTLSNIKSVKMSYNADELVAPEWVDPNFFKTVLNKNFNSTNVKIIDFKTYPATQAGDHYASIMFRAKVNYELNSEINAISLIVKAMPHVEGRKKDMFGTTDVMEIESILFGDILPRMTELLQTAGEEGPLAAKGLYFSQSPEKIIVFEDLKELGFQPFTRKIPSRNEVELIVTKLAEFHATSFQMVADGNTTIPKLSNTMFNMPHIIEMESFKTCYNLFQKFIASFKEFEEFSKKIEQIPYEKLIRKCTKECNTPGAYSVLNHGDFHLKNVMCKLEKDNVTSEIILVDFQLCHWGSPGLDLGYAKNLSPLERRNGLDEFYFKTFCNVLKMTNCKGKLPTLEDFRAELKRTQCIELFIYIMVFPFMCQREGDFNFEKLFSSPEYVMTFYESEMFITISKQMLPIFLSEGYLDF